MLDPQAKALLALIEEKGIPPVHELTPTEARKWYRDRRFYTQPAPPEMALVADLACDGPRGPIALRHYRPLGSAADAALPALVYMHGGGWVIGDLDTHDVLCRELSQGAGCAVVSVDYRMGPEHRFPAAFDDCLAALGWVHDNAATLRIDRSRLAVGGDSAGGNLAALVAIAARGQGPRLAFQLLIYPATDLRCESASFARNGNGYLLTAQSVAYYLGHYLADATTRSDPRVSPLLAEDLRDLPPALVLTAGFDPLRDEGIAYAQRLSEAGNRASLVSFERQIHGFVTMGKVIDEANAAVAICAARLGAALAPQAP